MNILVLNGSRRPRAFTDTMISSFREGAESKCHRVRVFNLRQMKIAPCLGCLRGGMNTKRPCTQQDDMNEIYDAYREADVIVFATPLFFWTYSGLLKIAMDRLWALAEGKEDELHNADKTAILFIAAGGANPDLLIQHFAYFVKRMGWKYGGHLSWLHTDDIDLHHIPKNEEAKKLGESL